MPTQRTVDAEALLERERELRAAAVLVSRAHHGDGGVLVLEGPPGIGKSALLRAIRDRARTAGAADLHAVGSELERSFAFGVVRQLLEPVLRRLTPKERGAALAGAAGLAAPVLTAPGPAAAGSAPEEDAFAVLHGLYWLCAGLAERKPLLLTLDDAQWADTPSLRFLAHVAHRLEGTAIALVLALRPGREAGQAPLFGQIEREPCAQTLRLSALSEPAGVRLTRSLMSSKPTDEVCRACHAAAAGNPFYLHEIVRTLEAEKPESGASEERRVELIHSRPVAQGVLARVARLPAGAERLARAAAVLGRGAQTRHAAALAGLDEEESHALADALANAHVLVPAAARLEFEHPVVRTSVYSDIPPSERALAHTRAARMLAGDGAAPESVAAHLLAGTRNGDPWAVEVLARAAAEARARAAPEAAANYLARALAEPAPEERRGELRFELGLARFAAGELDGTDDLREGYRLTTNPHRRAVMALALARCLSLAEHRDEAVGVLDETIAATAGSDGDLTEVLRAELVGAALINRSTLPRAREELERAARVPSTDTLPARVVLAYLAWYRAVSGSAHPPEILDLLERVRPIELIGEDTLAAFLHAVWALIYCERHGAAAELLDAAAARARRAGSVVGFSLCAASRADLERRRGSLLDAEAYAREAAAASSPVQYLIPWHDAFLAETLAERGCVDEAERVLEAVDAADEIPDLFDAYLLLRSLGAARCARSEARRGLEAYLECGRRLEQWGFRNPEVAAWRSQAALAHHRLGEAGEARRLAAEEVELARAFGAPGALGAALRVSGLVTGGGSGLTLLQEAVGVLEGADARLVLAHALSDLGAALRRDGRRRDAREPLRRALDLAHRCGAAPLAERTREELVAAGARPRRMAASGVDALTSSELRVARLAADGMTNREIAQALFVTTKTVAVHLTHTYRKLGIESRTQLPAALACERRDAA